MIDPLRTHRLSPGAYLGAAVRSQVVNGFILTESSYRSEHHLPAHEHERAFFYLVLDGVSIDESRARALTCTPGMLVYHPPGDRHSNRWERNGGRCLHFEIPTERLEVVGRHVPPLQEVRHFTGGMSVWLASRLHDEFRRPDAASPLAIEGLLLELIAVLSREEQSTSGRRVPNWLRSAKDRLLEECTVDVAIGDLAAEAGVHPTHFARAFRKAYGYTVGEFVRKARVERACSRLAGGATSLTRVAHEMGFCDQSHFTKAFKRVLGMTPSQFRERFGPR